jgi:hypothetical protein
MVKVPPELEAVLEELMNIRQSSKPNEEKFLKQLRTWAIAGKQKKETNYGYQFIPDDEPVIDCFHLLVGDYEGKVFIYHMGTGVYSVQDTKNIDVKDLERAVREAGEDVEIATKPTYTLKDPKSQSNT